MPAKLTMPPRRPSHRPGVTGGVCGTRVDSTPGSDASSLTSAAIVSAAGPASGYACCPTQQSRLSRTRSRAIARLDADHRIVVVLRYWADLSVDEIAARLDVPSGTVKSRLHYALRSMRPRLEETR
jgi:DNA-directed RNA polymerase specialized sigma24 family protein